ncbi:MAG: hypothetical protein DI570_14505 [Phenylobacterium zucineum]|nr:MAG: hypothetical protein DI570_14505 [Phenylobacterium zucineum]
MPCGPPASPWPSTCCPNAKWSWLVSQRLQTLALTVLAAVLAQPAAAAVIVAPVSVSVAAGGTGNPNNAVSNVINQSGLSVRYTPGVTDFDTYVAQAIAHTGALRTEWHSAQSSRSAQLLFDFGTEVTLDRLALWDENNTVQNSMTISTPELGVIRSFSPKESIGTPYTAEVFSFRKITTRYLTLSIDGCGEKPEIMTARWCALGEVVFASAPAGGAVPEPSTWALMIGGFGLAGATLRRRRAAPAAAGLL